MWTVQSLYKLAIQTLVESDLLNLSCLECLSGLVKEDILNIALLRGKTNLQLSSFLHNDIKVLQTREFTISHEDLTNIGKCYQLRVLEMNPPPTTRFGHPSNLLNGMLSQLRCLVKLHLQRNNGVTDNVMETLVSHTSTLQELDVSGCLTLTDCAAESLATLPRLQALKMSQTQVSDEGLMCLARGRCALSLTELCMNSCVNIRGHSLKHIIKCCQNLRILGLSGCTNLSRLVTLRYLSRRTSRSFFRMCCNLPCDLSPCHHCGNTILKLRHTGLLIIQ